MRRRTFLESTALAGVSLAARRVAEAQTESSARSSDVLVGWLGGTPPALTTGVSWGIPWPRGAYQKDHSFTLTGNDGTTLPLQSWPLAFWPDGSLKWSGFASVADPGLASPLRLASGNAATLPGGPAVKVREDAAGIDVDTGKLQCRIPRAGETFIDSMTVDGRIVARGGRLLCTLEDRSAADVIRLQDFSSAVRKATAEQTGPVRAVVRIEGMHKADKGSREWLPFTIRLYFYAGDAAVRMVHSIVFDGDQEKDFIHGLGVQFAVPMREQIHNRHVRFSGEDSGLWAEPVQPATGARRLTAAAGDDLYAAQLAGQRIPNKDQYNAQGQFLLDNWAVWDSFKLVQPTCDGFTIQKRTHPQCCWVGRRSGKARIGAGVCGRCERRSGGCGEEFLAVLPRLARSSECHLRGRRRGGMALVTRRPCHGPAVLRHTQSHAGGQL